MYDEIIDLTDDQIDEIETKLEAYDDRHMPSRIQGRAAIGVVQNGELIAGADGCMTAYRIFYLSTLFVEEDHRGRGVGRMLMEQIEEKAAALGANMIRLDTFDWQGEAFYRKLGYEQIGSYTHETDGFSEYFFLKRL